MRSKADEIFVIVEALMEMILRFTFINIDEKKKFVRRSLPPTNQILPPRGTRTTVWETLVYSIT